MSELQLLSTAARLSRRQLLGAAALTALGASGVLAASKPDADGLYDEPWLLKSRDLATDFAAAISARKQFAILWETPNCPWCRVLHSEAFQDRRIVEYIEKHFTVVHLNFKAMRKVTGFDGKSITDTGLADAHEIGSSPTLQFFVPDLKTPGRELGRIGYMKVPEFYGMLQFVQEKGYEEGPFDEWMERRS